MKLTKTLLSAAIAAVCTISATGLPTTKKVGVVIALRGDVKLNHADSRSVEEKVRLLGLVYESDNLTMAPGSQITISVLATGTRYTIKGPYTKLKVPENGAFKPSQDSITEIKETGSAGVVASQALDHASAGGVSSRISAVPIFTDIDQPLIPISKFASAPKPDDNGRIEIWWAPGALPWEKSHATLVKVQGQIFVKADRIVPEGQSYLLSMQEEEPTSVTQAEVRVSRYSGSDMTGIHRLTKEHTSQEDWMELYGTYVELHLFERARAILSQMKATSPEATDWNQITVQLDQDQEDSEKRKATTP